MNFEKPTAEDAALKEQEVSAVIKNKTNKNEKHVKNAVLKIQKFFLQSAQKYLDKDGDKHLKAQIIKFYSDENRLSAELANVFAGIEEEDIDKKIEEMSTSLDNKENFLEYVETKNFATSSEERVSEEERIRSTHKLRDEKQLEVLRDEISKIDSHIVDLKSEPRWKGTEFWTEEIEAAGVLKKLKFFNDVVTEKKPPHPGSGYGEPILQDIILDGKKTDIYHSDNKRGITMNRLFLHIKE